MSQRSLQSCFSFLGGFKLELIRRSARAVPSWGRGKERKSEGVCVGVLLWFSTSAPSLIGCHKFNSHRLPTPPLLRPSTRWAGCAAAVLQQRPRWQIGAWLTRQKIKDTFKKKKKVNWWRRRSFLAYIFYLFTLECIRALGSKDPASLFK